MKYDFERAVALSQETGTPEQLDSSRRFWSEFPWSVGVTDKDGQVEIGLTYTSIDRTWGSTPPSDRDALGGRPYLVRVNDSETCEEELKVLMNPGAVVKGESYTVTVIDIQQPQYVEGSEETITEREGSDESQRRENR